MNGVRERRRSGIGKKKEERAERKNESRDEAVAKRGATRGLPRGSPILVLLSPRHA